MVINEHTYDAYLASIGVFLRLRIEIKDGEQTKIRLSCVKHTNKGSLREGAPAEQVRDCNI